MSSTKHALKKRKEWAQKRMQSKRKAFLKKSDPNGMHSKRNALKKGMCSKRNALQKKLAALANKKRRKSKRCPHS